MTGRFMVIGATGGGMTRFRGQLLEDLARKGFEVLAVAAYASERELQEIRRRGAIPLCVRYRRASLNPFRELWYLIRLAWVIHRHRPDILLSYTVKPVVYGGLLARLLGVGRFYALITGAGSLLRNAGPGAGHGRAGLAGWLYRNALGNATGIFFQNEDDRALFVGRGLADPARTAVVPGSGVDLVQFSFCPPPAGQEITFLFMGRYLREKGFCDFLRAARLLGARHPLARFVIAGGLDERSGREERALLAVAVRERLVDDLGFVEDVLPCLRNSHVMVLPSYGEGVPRSVLEAMSTGRPVITTEAPGCRETVQPGRNGYLVPVGDVGGLMRCMETFLLQPQVIEPMGACSRRLVEERFAVEDVNRLIFRNMGLA